MSKKELSTCNQCHREMTLKVGVFDTTYRLLGVCSRPDCPNYSLLAIPVEMMPKEKKNE